MTVTSSIPTPVTFSGPSLSPSRAADFKTCPLLFRYRTIDKLPERPSADQVRGTLVHAVLESLFDLPAAERTPAAAAALVAPSWERLLAQEPALADLFAAAPSSVPSAAAPSASALPGSLPAGSARSAAGLSGAAPDASSPLTAVASGAETAVAGGSAARDGGSAVLEIDTVARDASPIAPDGGFAARDARTVAGEVVAEALPGTESLAASEPARLAEFLAGAADLLHGYFAVEDPRRFEPAERESLVNTLVGDELLIRGYIDRLDISPAGDLRVVDYKTGGAPREAFEGRALFQLKFYALVLWRTRGVVPRVLRLLYLKDAEICDYSPDAEELERFERTLVALSQAIERAKRDRDFRPKPSRLCGWCSHQAVCPEFGGTPPPYPEPADAADAPKDADAPENAAGIPGQATRGSATDSAVVGHSVVAGPAAGGPSVVARPAAGGPSVVARPAAGGPSVVARPAAGGPAAVGTVTGTEVVRLVDPTDYDM